MSLSLAIKSFDKLFMSSVLAKRGFVLNRFQLIIIVFILVNKLEDIPQLQSGKTLLLIDFQSNNFDTITNSSFMAFTKPPY